MGIFSRFERHMEDGVEGAANKVFNAPLSPVQISKRAERAMHREKMVGAGQQYAPTLYTVLVSPQDDERLWGYYPTLAGETETYLSAKAAEAGFLMDGHPLVRFICDGGLRRGKFDVVAELVSAPIIAQLRQEEMQRYGLAGARRPDPAYPQQQQQRQVAAPSQYVGQVPAQQAAPMAAPASDAPRKREPLPYVPESEIDRSIDYGEYTFNSQDWDDYQQNGPSASFDFEPAASPVPVTGAAAAPVAAAPVVQAPAAQPAVAPAAMAQPAAEQAPEAADLSGFDVDSYDRSAVDSRDFEELAPASAQPVAAQPAAPVPDDHAYFDAPDTAVFAAGLAQANPVPDQAIVRAQLVNIATNQRIDLASNRLIVGRGRDCDIPIDDSSASRSHAQIAFEPQGVWTITDLGSTNGTAVNGQRITATHALQEGDRIRMGTTDFAFTLG